MHQGWKCIKDSAPAFLRDMLTKTVMKGLKSLKRGGVLGLPNIKRGIQGIKRGGKHAIKGKTDRS